MRQKVSDTFCSTKKCQTLFAWLIATVGGVGHVPFAPGTAASALAVAIWWAAPLEIAGHLSVGLGLVVVGIWSAGRLESQLGRTDPSTAVIDEVAGMWLVLTGLPKLWPVALLAFAAFRLFDIIKPPPVRWLERLPGGLGIMSDDVGAAALARLLVALLMPVFAGRG